jgi:hypothetical protein
MQFQARGTCAKQALEDYGRMLPRRRVIRDHPLDIRFSRVCGTVGIHPCIMSSYRSRGDLSSFRPGHICTVLHRQSASSARRCSVRRVGFLTSLALSFASDFEFVSDLAIDFMVFGDTSVDADAFALAEIRLGVACNALVLARTRMK